MQERRAVGVGPDRIDVAYERRGSLEDPPLLLIMGVGAQLVNWPEGFCDALVDRGLQVVRFDNRDSGRSTHMTEAPVPDLPAALAGDFSSVSYTLSDMAADAVGLLDALDLDDAHVVGASMGGAIAQTIAIEHPSRVRSLTSMMFTTGEPAVGQTPPETLAALFGGPAARSREEVVDRAARMASLVGSRGFDVDVSGARERAALAYDRGHDEDAIARQAVANVASGDRTKDLLELDVPALVVHGTDDRLIDASGGRATADAITGAELMLVEGMGHDLPSGVWNRLADAIAAVVARGEERVVRSA